MKPLLIKLVILPVLAISAQASTGTSTSCTTSKEFITALEFLKQDSEFKIQDKEAQKIALQIAEGCTGSAGRFIRVAKTLTRADATNKDAIQIGLKFVGATEAETETFMTVFRRAIAEDSLDLSLDQALQISQELAKDFSGDQKQVRDDFDQLADYCANTKRLGLPRQQCGTFAAKLAKSGMQFPKGVFQSFSDAMEFLKSDSGPHLTTHDALQLASTLAAQGELGFENFKQAYQYASSDKGLKLARGDAIEFAKKLSLIKNATPTANPAKK